MLSNKLKTIFHSRCHIKNKVCRMIIDNGICINVTSTNLVRKLNLTTTKHSTLYKLQWLNECADIIVTKCVLFSFSVKRYKNKILNDIVSMCAAHTYCCNLIGRSNMMILKIGMHWKRIWKDTHLHHCYLDKCMRINWSWRKLEQTLLQDNSEDVKLSETKMSHECETSRGKVSSIKDKLKGFIQNK